MLAPSISRTTLLKGAGAASLAALGAGLAWPARADNGLLVMDWTGYEIPELHQAYIKKHGASPEISIFRDLE